MKDGSGAITELRCTIDPETKSGSSQSSRKVKGTIHWVSAAHAVSAEVRLYDRLFSTEDAGNADSDFRALINPDSLVLASDCKLEPSLASAAHGNIYQFERVGYFNVDPDSKPNHLVFNRTVTLRDSWAKEAQKAV